MQTPHFVMLKPKLTGAVCCGKAATLSLAEKNKQAKKSRGQNPTAFFSSLNLTNHYQIPEDHCGLQPSNKGPTLPEILPRLFHFRLQNWILWNNVWHSPSFPVGKTSKCRYRSIHFSQKKNRKWINWNIYYSNTTSQGISALTFPNQKPVHQTTAQADFRKDQRQLNTSAIYMTLEIRWSSQSSECLRSKVS